MVNTYDDILNETIELAQNNTYTTTSFIDENETFELLKNKKITSNQFTGIFLILSLLIDPRYMFTDIERDKMIQKLHIEINKL